MTVPVVVAKGPGALNEASMGDCAAAAPAEIGAPAMHQAARMKTVIVSSSGNRPSFAITLPLSLRRRLPVRG